MPALHAESSTVSLPPRERALTKRRAKAIKLGLPPSTSGKSPAKAIQKRGKAPMPPPTLAATRQRRAAADVAYLDRPDGYHIKRVVRRQTPGPAPPIPYLPGEEDIPPSNAESDDSNATLPELARPADPSELNLGFNVASEVEDMLPEMDPDLLDYDAEGEDKDMDVCMEGISLTNCSSYAIPGRTGDGSCSMAGTVPTLSARPVNPLADASEDDIQALFGSLDNLHFGDGPSTSGGGFFPSTNFADTLPGPPDNQLVAHAHYLFGNGLHSTHGSNAWEPATNHSPPQPSEIGRVGYPMQPPTNDLPDLCPPQSRVPTPAPWIAVPEIQAHVLHPLTGPAPPLQSTPSPARNNSGYTLVSSTGIPTGLPFSLRAPTASCPCPHLSTRELVAQVRAQAQSPHLRIPPPTGVNDNLHASSPLARHEFGSRALSPTPLRHSLSLPEFLGGTGDNTDDTMSDTEEQDPDAPRPSTPVAWEDTDIGLDESSPIQVTQAWCRASRYLNFQRLVPRQVANNPRRIPTLLEVNMNIRRLFKVNCRRQRSCAPVSTPETSRRRRNRVLLRSSALTPDQQAVISPMEYRVLLDVVCSNPWPEDREVYLEAAEKYSTALTGISGPDVFTSGKDGTFITI
ncbi:hypothetical protein FS749_011786 [Ceratobasidium sp. UAMH 11750]|nr:hypothetical protein FS749_011786 [Ceratobasidium sp. UAMH 11750]